LFLTLRRKHCVFTFFHSFVIFLSVRNSCEPLAEALPLTGLAGSHCPRVTACRLSFTACRFSFSGGAAVAHNPGLLMFDPYRIITRFIFSSFKERYYLPYYRGVSIFISSTTFSLIFSFHLLIFSSSFSLIPRNNITWRRHRINIVGQIVLPSQYNIYIIFLI
jgi:hypothetical protein